MKKSVYLKIALVLSLTMLLLTALPTETLAWLKTTVDQTFNLGADPSPDLALYMGTWDGASGTYHWSAPLKMKDSKPAKSFGTPIGSAVRTQSVNADMGVIDRLDKGSLTEANYTWFCIRVHEDEGLHFKDVKIEYAQEPFQFWGTQWTNGNQGQIVHMPAQNDGAAGSILQQLFADTNPDTAAIPTLMETAAPAKSNGTSRFISSIAPQDGPMPGVYSQTGYIGQRGEGKSVPTEDTAGADGYYTASGVDGDGYYYIYFRIGPNLDAYYKLVDKLYLYMPCYLSFDNLTISIDVKKS